MRQKSFIHVFSDKAKSNEQRKVAFILEIAGKLCLDREQNLFIFLRKIWKRKRKHNF